MRNQVSAALATGPAPPAEIRDLVHGAFAHRREQLAGTGRDRAEDQGEDRRGGPLLDGPATLPGAEPARRPAGGAVFEESADDRDQRQQRAADAQRAERHRPEVPDDGRVDEHERRLGGEHHER